MNPWLGQDLAFEHPPILGTQKPWSSLTSTCGIECCKEWIWFAPRLAIDTQVTLRALSNSMEPCFLPWEMAATSTVKSCEDLQVWKCAWNTPHRGVGCLVPAGGQLVLHSNCHLHRAPRHQRLLKRSYFLPLCTSASAITPGTAANTQWLWDE